jgi:hypothetical protein
MTIVGKLHGHEERARSKSDSCFAKRRFYSAKARSLDDSGDEKVSKALVNVGMNKNLNS